MKKRLLCLALCGLALAGAGCWFLTASGRTADADEYTFAPVEFGRAAETVSATGVLHAREVFPVGTELSGRVVEILADFNDTVAEGDVLLRLDDRQARQRLRQADVGVELARVALKQAEAARDTAEKAVARERGRSPEVRRQADVDLVESQLRSAEVTVEAARVRINEAEEARRQAELALELTTVRVPTLATVPLGSSGYTAAAPNGVGTLSDADPTQRPRRSFVVLERRASLNQQVAPPASAKLFALAGDLDRMQVQAQVAEGDVNKITRGMAVEFTVSGGADEPTFRGNVEEIHLTPINDRGAVFYKIVLDVNNERDAATKEWHLRPGQTATVDVLRRVHESVWKMPAAALNFQPEGPPSDAARAKLAAWRERPDAALWRPVWAAGADGRPWPVFVRVGGHDARGEAGVQDSQSSEVLEWDPELAPRLDPREPANYPRFIIGMPPAKKGGLFSVPKIKL